jgi:hypothetical protein
MHWPVDLNESPIAEQLPPGAPEDIGFVSDTGHWIEHPFLDSKGEEVNPCCHGFVPAHAGGLEVGLTLFHNANTGAAYYLTLPDDPGVPTKRTGFALGYYSDLGQGEMEWMLMLRPNGTGFVWDGQGDQPDLGLLWEYAVTATMDGEPSCPDAEEDAETIGKWDFWFFNAKDEEDALDQFARTVPIHLPENITVTAHFQEDEG